MNRRGFLRTVGAVLTGLVGGAMMITALVFIGFVCAGRGGSPTLDLFRGTWIACGGLYLVLVSLYGIKTPIDK